MEVPSSPLHQSLQVFAGLQWVFSFLGLGESKSPESDKPALLCLVALVLASLGRTWTLAVLYLTWLYRDRYTPRMGVRRSAWVRNWAIWRYFPYCFPITLVKTAELGPSRNYLFGFHPHGVLVVGAFSNFCTEAIGFSRLFSGLKPHLLMLPCWFQVPLFRDYIITSGLVSSDKASAPYLLTHPEGGQMAVLAVGGPLEAKPGTVSLQLRNQKRFIKLSLEHGASLVPVFSFGEKELFQQYPNPPGSWVRRVQEALQAMLSVSSLSRSPGFPATLPRAHPHCGGRPHSSLVKPEAQPGTGGPAARVVCKSVSHSCLRNTRHDLGSLLINTLFLPRLLPVPVSWSS